MRHTKLNFYALRKSFNKLNDEFISMETQFKALKVLDESQLAPAVTPKKTNDVTLVNCPVTPVTAVCPSIVINDDEAGPSSKIVKKSVRSPGDSFHTPRPAPKPLLAVPLRKQVFVSRLHPDTLAEDVIAYIQSKIPNSIITVEKFKFKYSREISSFKLNVPPELFDTICCSSFWPQDLLVKEFTFKTKSRPTVSLPKLNFSTVKPTKPTNDAKN